MNRSIIQVLAAAAMTLPEIISGPSIEVTPARGMGWQPSPYWNPYRSRFRDKGARRPAGSKLARKASEGKL